MVAEENICSFGLEGDADRKQSFGPLGGISLVILSGMNSAFFPLDFLYFLALKLPEWDRVLLTYISSLASDVGWAKPFLSAKTFSRQCWGG